jgi:uncharacterized membrane protein
MIITVSEELMSASALYSAALLLGVVAGLRTFTAPAAVSWAAALGALPLERTWLAFLGNRITAWVITALALVELVVDQLPRTPSRRVPWQFAGRIVSGAICGAAVAMAASWPIGLALGVVGAIVGTLGGSKIRASLARAFRRDAPAGLLEDGVAIASAALIVLLVLV